MSQRTAAAANATSPNVLAGLLHELTQYKRAALRLACVAAAFGAQVTLTIDSRVAIQSQAVSFANRYPVIGQDDAANEVAYRGQRVFLTFTNTTGATINIDWLLDVVPY
jgi:hypothetical protein